MFGTASMYRTDATWENVLTLTDHHIISWTVSSAITGWRWRMDGETILVILLIVVLFIIGCACGGDKK